MEKIVISVGDIYFNKSGQVTYFVTHIYGNKIRVICFGSGFKCIRKKTQIYIEKQINRLAWIKL